MSRGPIESSFVCRSCGSGKQPTTNAARSKPAASAYRNLDTFAILISLNASHRANFVVSTPSAQRYYLGCKPKSYRRYYRKPGLGGGIFGPISKHTLVYSCFGNLPQRAAAWHSSNRL